MSTQPQPTANMANPQSALIPMPSLSQTDNRRGGPRTEEGKANSSKNAINHGLFAARDFIRPGEHTLYSELAESLHSELAPSGPLELTLVDEIRRAMWRLRRCGEVESNFIIGLDDGTGYIFDPMETANAKAEKVQRSVDCARSLSHRLLHKCTGELRKLQTERNLRREDAAQHSDRKPIEATAPPEKAPQPPQESSFCKPPIHPDEAPPRNAACPCGSGLKHKRCCGKDAPAVLHAA
jgi:hypothetical protein